VRQGRYEEGLPLLKRAVEIDLGFTDAQRSLGRAYLGLGEYALAVRHLQDAEMQAPGHGPTRAALAEASSRLAAEKGSELEKLRAATEAAPENLQAALAWVRALRNVGRLDDALAFQLARDAAFSGDATWQYEMAVTYVLRNDRDRAIERYRKSLALEPDEPQRIVELAMLLLERRGPGDVDEAARLAVAADALAPNAPVVLACRAEVAVARGDTATAARLLRRAAEALPEGHPQRRLFIERARALGDKGD